MASSRRAVCAIVVALLPISARADAAEPLDITMTYEAPRECPSRAALEDELRTRVKTSWLKGSDTRTFDVRIARLAGGGYGGRLSIVQPDQAPSIREVRATSCREAIRSVAVFIAIALEPASEATSAPNEAREFATETPAHDVTPSSSVERPARSTRSPAPPPLRAPSSPPWLWSAGYEVTYLSAPSAAWGGRVHAELARDGRPIGPALRVSWGYASFSTFPDRAGEAKFQLKTVRIEGCARFVLSSIVAAACGGVDAGSLIGNTPALAGSLQATTRWVAAAALLRASWMMTSWLSIGAEIGAFVPFERTSFTLSGPSRFVHRAPPVLFGGGAGLGVTARFR